MTALLLLTNIHCKYSCDGRCPSRWIKQVSRSGWQLPRATSPRWTWSWGGKRGSAPMTWGEARTVPLLHTMLGNLTLLLTLKLLPQSGSKLLTGITDVVALIECSVSLFFYTLKAHWWRTVPHLTEQELMAQRPFIKLLMTQRKNTKCAHRTGWCGLNPLLLSSSWKFFILTSDQRW